MNFASCWSFKFPFERKTPSRQHFFELYLKLPSIPLKQQWSISYVDNSYLYCYVTYNMRGACILRVLELVVYFLTIFIWGVQIFQVNYRLYTGRCVFYKTPCMEKNNQKTISSNGRPVILWIQHARLLAQESQKDFFRWAVK